MILWYFVKLFGLINTVLQYVVVDSTHCPRVQDSMWTATVPCNPPSASLNLYIFGQDGKPFNWTTFMGPQKFLKTQSDIPCPKASPRFQIPAVNCTKWLRIWAGQDVQENRVLIFKSYVEQGILIDVYVYIYKTKACLGKSKDSEDLIAKKVSRPTWDKLVKCLSWKIKM